MSRLLSIAKTRRGTSLIEVLVVLAVLVIGILAIARLFPAGFYTIRGGQNSDLANRLAAGALDELTKNNASLPDGIYMYSEYAPGASGFDPQYLPTNLNPLTDSAGNNFNDIDKQRWISSETITIPSNRYAQSASPMTFQALYTVNYGPIYLPDQPRAEGTSGIDFTTHVPFLEVDGMPWTAVTGDSSADPTTGLQPSPADLIAAGQSHFAEDLNLGNIAIPSEPYAQIFTITVTDSSTPPHTITDTITVPKTYAGGWFAPSTEASDASQWSALKLPFQTITLFRPFRCVGYSTTPTWQDPVTMADDPYEYALYSANLGTASAGFNLGILAFNPLAAGQNGAQPLQARISYEVYDWHILHEDHVVSGGANTGSLFTGGGSSPPVIRLALDHIKRNGDIQFDQSVYNGFIPSTTGVADVLWLNLDNGEYDTTTTASLYNTSDPTKNFPQNTTLPSVDYATGSVYLAAPQESEHMRFYYMAQGDWGLAVQKAPSIYTLASSVSSLASPGSGTPNVYVFNTTGAAGANAQILFPACDCGKTVEFDFLTYQTNASPPQTVTVPVATATISTQTETVQGSSVAFVNLGKTGLYASDIAPDIGAAEIGPPATSHLNSGLVVRGVSARAVVIWRERQSWKMRTVDTVLTNPQ